MYQYLNFTFADHIRVRERPGGYDSISGVSSDTKVIWATILIRSIDFLVVMSLFCKLTTMWFRISYACQKSIHWIW